MFLLHGARWQQVADPNSRPRSRCHGDADSVRGGGGRGEAGRAGRGIPCGVTENHSPIVEKDGRSSPASQ